MSPGTGKGTALYKVKQYILTGSYIIWNGNSAIDKTYQAITNLFELQNKIVNEPLPPTST